MGKDIKYDWEKGLAGTGLDDNGGNGKWKVRKQGYIRDFVPSSFSKIFSPFSCHLLYQSIIILVSDMCGFRR